MSNQITTYSSDIKIINYEAFIAAPSLERTCDPLPLHKISIDIACLDILDKMLEIPYVIYQSHFFSFKKALKCKLTHKKNLFYLIFNELNLTVWGSSQEETIEAFSFQFHSLYHNFALENDDNLSAEAKILKLKILDLISLVL